jgi:hypothetical protein
VYKLALSGFLASKRDGRRTVYKRSDIERAAPQYIFLPEMLERSPFNVEHELGRWLKSVGIERLSEWTKSIFPIYDRANFERVHHLMPCALENVEIQERTTKRVPTELKRKAIAEVKTGLTTHFVSRRFGVSGATAAFLTAPPSEWPA